MKRRTLLAACAATAAAWPAARAFAQGYPERPVKLYQGFAPGGNADAIARAIAFAVEQPPTVDVNEIVVRPTAQS